MCTGLTETMDTYPRGLLCAADLCVITKNHHERGTKNGKHQKHFDLKMIIQKFETEILSLIPR